MPQNGGPSYRRTSGLGPVHGIPEFEAIAIEPDPQNADRDKYNRLLRYVYLPDGRLLNAEIIAQGYGHAYTRFPFAKMEEFRALEREARKNGRGLWGPARDAGSAGVAPAD
jgi:micrococcal nuclease